MRTSLPDKLERGRLCVGPYATTHGEDFGVFFIQGPCGRELKIMSSGHDTEFGWEHVSVSIETRIPNWEEMCFVKGLFWDDEETVMQLHPPKSTYVNCHPNCLHLWRPIKAEIPLPDPIMVGPVSQGRTGVSRETEHGPTT